MDAKVLRAPFSSDQLRQREGQGGKTISYVETHSIIARLNEGCDQWAFEIVEHKIIDQEVVVVARLTADGIVKMAFGGSAITLDRNERPVSIADDLKAAASDALKKAASLLGVGLELYGGRKASGAANEPPSSPAQNDRVTSRQLAALQSVARQKKIGRDRFTAILSERFHKREVRHLSRREASSLLSELTEANGTHS